MKNRSGELFDSTRRGLLKSSSALLTAACAAPLDWVSRNAPRVDMHFHVFQSAEIGRQVKQSPIWEYGDKPDLVESASLGSTAEALGDIRKAAFDRVVVAGILPMNFTRIETRAAWPKIASDAQRNDAEAALNDQIAVELAAYNDWVTGLAKRSRAFIPFVGADLGAPEGFDHLAMLEELQMDKGAKGIKIHPVIDQRAANDHAMWPIYDACVQLGLPILSHSGPSPAGASVQHGEPNAFHDALRAFPDLKLIVAHLGGASWRQTRALAEAFPNILFDLCEIIAYTGAPNAPTVDDVGLLIKEVGPHRVAFGSDYPWYDLDVTVSQLMNLPHLSTEEKEAILGRNAADFLQLEI
jgi:hypothetical protein